MEERDPGTEEESVRAEVDRSRRQTESSSAEDSEKGA